MENKSKQKYKDTIYYIKKSWLPLTLAFLILLNITIIPNILNNPDIKLNDMSFLLPSSKSTTETNVPLISSPITKEVKTQSQQELSPIDEIKPIEPEPIAYSPTDENAEFNTNKNKHKHNQNANFRFRLFLLIVFLSVLIFMVIITKEQQVYEYSAAKSATIYKDYNKLSRNSFESNDNI